MTDDREGRTGGTEAAHVEPLLDRYRTGELDDPDRLRVAAHLAGCTSCAALLADSEAFAATVGRGYLAERAAGPGDEPDWSRQRAAIVARTTARSARRARGAGLPRWAPQAALAVLAMIAVGVVYETGVRQPGDAERVLSSDSPPPAAGSRPAEDGGLQGHDEFSGEAGSQGKTAPLAAREDAGEGVRSETEHVAAKAAAPPVEADLDELETANRQAAGRQGADRREAEARTIGEEQAAADAAAPAAVAAPPENISRSRFEDRARRALADRDTLAAEEALTVWRDSLASGAGLDPAQKRLAQALADSLAAFLVSLP